MSHFTVLVIGENIEEQLQPFHEYECTGNKDQYVIFHAEPEEELREEYNSHKEDYATFEQFLQDYYGYQLHEGKWGRWTNPNKQWDWWQVGGRWSGFFKKKPSATSGQLGERSLLDRSEDTRNGYADHILKGEIDIDSMRDDAAKEASEKYDFAAEIIKSTPEHESWDSVRSRIKDIDAARNFYRSQERVKAFATAECHEKLGWSVEIEEYIVPKENFLQDARDSAVSTFAVIKDGVWHERGSMGWWGVVSDEKDKSNWNKEFAKLFDSIPDDEFVTLVDCHI